MRHKSCNSEQTLETILSVDNKQLCFASEEETLQWITQQVILSKTKFSWLKRIEVVEHVVETTDLYPTFYELFCYDENEHKFRVFLYPYVSKYAECYAMKASFDTMSDMSEMSFSSQSFLFLIFEAWRHCTFPVINNTKNYFISYSQSPVDITLDVYKTFRSLSSELEIVVQLAGTGVVIRTEHHTFKLSLNQDVLATEVFNVTKYGSSLSKGVYYTEGGLECGVTSMKNFTRYFYDFLHYELFPTLINE